MCWVYTSPQYDYKWQSLEISFVYFIWNFLVFVRELQIKTQCGVSVSDYALC
jgi:hypothetical protein